VPLRLKTLVCGQGNRSFFGSPNQPLTGNVRLRFLGKPKEMGNGPFTGYREPVARTSPIT
jgi:hypothetical protein